MASKRPWDLVIIGGGVLGLATAVAAKALRAKARVVVLEAARVGHRGASSAGASRITRVTYPDPRYVRLMERLHGDAWPELEERAGARLMHRRPGCLFGPAGGRVESYARALGEAGAAVEVLDGALAARRFPMFRMDGAVAIADPSAALVDAAATLEALRAVAARAGADVWERWPVGGIEPQGDGTVRLTGPDELTVRAERVVVAAGPWAAALVPALQGSARPVPQSVAYLDVAVPAGHPDEDLPVWAYLGRAGGGGDAGDGDDDGIWYGLPPYGAPGFKVARHLMTPQGPWPAAGSGGAPSPEARWLDDAEAFARRRFAWPVRARLRAEACAYTVTDSNHPIVSALPGLPSVIAAAGLSGHGFKLAPALGRYAASLALGEAHGWPSLDALADAFAWPGAGEPAGSAV